MMTRKFSIPILFTLLVALPFYLAGCGGGGTAVTGPSTAPPDNAGRPHGTVSVTVPWDSGRAAIPAEVKYIDLTIAAPDMAPVTTRIEKSQVQNGTAQASLQVPVGVDRVAKGVACDDKDQPQGRGASATFNVVAGQTTQVTLTIARVAAGSAIETKLGLNVSTSFDLIETQLKGNSAQFGNVSRSSDKLWWQFTSNGDLAYLYGSGRLVVVSDRNVTGLADVNLLEGELDAAMAVVQPVVSTFDNWKRSWARTYLQGVYTHQAGIYWRAHLPGATPDDWQSFEGELRTPPAPLKEARMVADSLLDGFAWQGNYKNGESGVNVDGQWLGWEGNYGVAWGRIFASVSPSSGNHAVKAYGSYYYRARLYLEALFSVSVGAGEQFAVVDKSSMASGPTLVSKHITELVLGP